MQNIELQRVGMLRVVCPTLTELDKTITNPAQNVYETVAQLYNVEFCTLGIQETVGAETVEFRVTVDGIVIVTVAGIALNAAGNDSTIIDGTLWGADGGQNLELGAAAVSLVSTLNAYPYWIRGKNVLIEMRKTTAAGASTFRVQGLYWQYS